MNNIFLYFKGKHHYQCFSGLDECNTIAIVLHSYIFGYVQKYILSFMI